MAATTRRCTPSCASLCTRWPNEKTPEADRSFHCGARASRLGRRGARAPVGSDGPAGRAARPEHRPVAARACRARVRARVRPVRAEELRARAGAAARRARQAGGAAAAVPLPRQADRGRQALGLPRQRRRKPQRHRRNPDRRLPRRQGDRERDPVHLPAPQNQAEPPPMKKIILIALLLAAACAHDKFRENRELIEAGNVDEGLTRIAEQVKQNPNDVELRNYLALGDNALGAGQLDAAAEAYRKALALDAENARAKAGMPAVEMARRHKAALAEAGAALKAGNATDAASRLKQILSENP